MEEDLAKIDQLSDDLAILGYNMENATKVYLEQVEMLEKAVKDLSNLL